MCWRVVSVAAAGSAKSGSENRTAARHVPSADAFNGDESVRPLHVLCSARYAKGTCSPRPGAGLGAAQIELSGPRSARHDSKSSALVADNIPSVQHCPINYTFVNSGTRLEVVYVVPSEALTCEMRAYPIQQPVTVSNFTVIVQVDVAIQIQHTIRTDMLPT